jgi:hypothetical protein
LGYGTKYKEISIDGGMKKKRAFKHPHRIIYGTALICFDNVQTTERYLFFHDFHDACTSIIYLVNKIYNKILLVFC